MCNIHLHVVSLLRYHNLHFLLNLDYFFVANEGISILENWGGMGLPLPQKLVDTLEQLKNNNNPKNEKGK